jgi:hypothetical protein
MKKTYLTLSLVTLFTLTACNNKTETDNPQAIQKHTKNNTPPMVKYIDNPEIQAKGMKQIKGLISGVKPALEATFKTDKSGIEGMKMCSTSAQKMGKKYNETLPKDSHIRRTALKYRNPDNKPDATDIVVMEKLKSNNTFNKPLVVDMKDHYRVYKALPVHKPCLACHGDAKEFSPQMSQIIKKNYPNDLAIDFKEHDFRGVIVSEIKK